MFLISCHEKHLLFLVLYIIIIRVKSVNNYDTASHFTFQQTEQNELVISQYHEHQEEVIVPQEVDGKKVVAIGNNSFEWSNVIKTVKIPSSIERIEEEAFERDEKLQEVFIEDGLKVIEEHAFGNCCNLWNITLPDTVESIGRYAFGGCKSLKEFVIPKRVKEIEDKLFYGCEALEKLVIPASVTAIEDDAMDYCDKLKIYTEEGSYASKYARENGIPCIIINSYGDILYEQPEDKEFLQKKTEKNVSYS